MKTGHLRRAHDPAGAARSSLQRHAQLQHRRIEPAQHERRVRQRAARRRHAVPGVRRPPVGARPVHEHRVLRAGQLAREAGTSPSTPASASTTSPRPRARATRSRSSSPSASTRRRRRCCIQPTIDRTAPRARQSGDRRDACRRLHRPPGAGHRATSSTAWQVYDGTPQQRLAVQGGAAPRLRLGRDRRRQDRGSRRRRRVLRPLLATTTSSTSSSCRRSSTPTRPTTRRSRTCSSSPLTATPTAVRRIRGVRAAGRLQLEPRRAARHRLEPGRRRRLRRQRRARPARSPRDINGRPYGYALPAVEPGSDQRDQRGRRSRCPTICCGRTAATARSHSASSPATPTTTRCSSR